MQGRRPGFDCLGWEDPLEKGMATHSGILSRGMLWTEEAGRLHPAHGVAKAQTPLSS